MANIHLHVRVFNATHSVAQTQHKNAIGLTGSTEYAYRVLQCTRRCRFQQSNSKLNPFTRRESRQSDVGRVSCFTLDEKSTERRIRVSLHANVSKKGNRCHSSKRATCLHGRRSRSFKKKTFCCILKRTSLFSCVVYAASPSPKR